MSSPLLAAVLVLLALGLAHSVLGEVILLKHLPRFQGIPTVFGSDVFHKRSLRAAWHTPTVLGCGFAAALFKLATVPALSSEQQFLIKTISVSLAVSALLWLIISRGKHLGWPGFAAAAVLAWLGASS